jgi:predicted 3-demethylubiquinone-9 3-methyltransferase (glyoxalase superfamily)
MTGKETAMADQPFITCLWFDTQAEEAAAFYTSIFPCADQAEVAYYWSNLVEGGQEVVCGWLKDKYGLCWQIVPAVFFDMVADPDQAKAAQVTQAMFGMTKFDVAALERAYAGV